MKEAVKKVGPKGVVVHIAHSQGALITFLASKKLTKSEMSQIEVICFGGAETIRRSEEFPFARCVNYYSVNDPLLLLVPSAARALRSGFLGIGDESCVKSSSLVMNSNTEPELVFLTPRSGDPILDHGLFGPTYIDALRWEGRRYQMLYLSIFHQVAEQSITKLILLVHNLFSRIFEKLEVFITFFIQFIIETARASTGKKYYEVVEVSSI